MIDLNKILIVGRLTRKPELRYLPSGTSVVAEFGIAYNRRYRSKQSNDYKEEVSFFNVKAFGKLAEFAGEYLDKGKAVFIEGRLTQDRWEANDGTRREKVVITADRINFAESKGAESGGSGDQGGGSWDDASSGGGHSGGSNKDGGGDTENDLPF